jgi:hypothetical protein
MQLKEAATHPLPGADSVAPLAKFADRAAPRRPREELPRPLKLYVFAGSYEPALLATVAEIVAKLLPKATNVYQPRQ